MKLFVGNLPYNVSDEDLREIFEAFGTVISARIIMDRDTGRSKGFGFVEMANADEAEQAMKQLDGQDKDGRPMVVNPARDNQRTGAHR